MTAIKDVKVLVVDDNALILDLLMKGLAPHCEAIAAADGADALLKIVDDPPDLILCDYRMIGPRWAPALRKTSRAQTD